MKRFLYNLSFLSIFVALLTLVVSCEKVEKSAKEKYPITIVEELGECVVVRAVIPYPEELDFNALPDSLKINLSHPDDRTVVSSFWFVFDKVDDMLAYTLYLPSDNLPQDGEYRVSMFEDEDGRTHFCRYKIKFDDLKIVTVSNSTYKYSLQGKGTEDSPYKITSYVSLVNFATSLQKDPEHGYGLVFSLENDIDMMDYYKDPGRVTDQGWCGIGNEFAGIFKGNGKRIYNILHSDSNSDDVGLFKSLSDGAKISNLILDKVNITSAKYSVGALAGRTEGYVTLDGIEVSGYIKGVNNIGGIVGYGKGNLIMSNCKNSGLYVESTGTNAGALVGALESERICEISNCESTGAVKANKAAGGLVGCTISGDIRINDNYVFATSILSSTSDCGGIVANNGADLSIYRCKVFHSSSENYVENVIGTSSTDNVGGIVGYSAGRLGISDSEVSTPITGRERVGGMVGLSDANIVMRDCDNSSNSQIRGVKYVGGLIGYDNGSAEVIYCEQRCAVVASQGYVGGMIGYSTGYSSLTTIYLNAQVQGGDYYVGGLVGYAMHTTVKNAHFTDAVRVNGPHDVGGLFGKVENCTIKSDFLEENSTFGVIVNNKEEFSSSAISVGGIAGCAVKCDFEKLVVKASVYGNKYVGGIVGYMSDGRRRVGVQCL